MKNPQNTSQKNYLVAILCFVVTFGYGQTYTPGVPTFDPTGYVEYMPGNLPVVISVPHGGYEEPTDISDRNCDTFTCERDAFTQELAKSIYQAFFEQTGCFPHVVINRLHRKKLDANREIIEAANGDPIAEEVWYNYHTLIDTAKQQIVQHFNRGIFLDLHGHGHTVQRIELGYLLTKANLQLSDSLLNTNTYINKSSIQTLVDDNLQGLSHALLLRGDNSFGSLLENRDIPAVPSGPDPAPMGDELYFNGGYNTVRHGSRNGGNIDAIQLECHQSIRFDEDLRQMLAENLTEVINSFIELHYHNNYTATYCNSLSQTFFTPPAKATTTTLFPNPATDYFFIESNKSELDVYIYNTLGHLVMTTQWAQSSVFVGDLENGSYVVELKEKGKLVASVLLVKL